MQSSLALIPKPESVQVHPGSCRLLPGSAIAAPPEGRQAVQLLERVTGFARAVEGAAIRLVIDPAVPGEEAYRLDVSSDGVRIAASTPAGLFYGAQTLRQLLPPGAEREGITQPVELPCLSIADRPRFAYRGFMLDASRHFFAPAEIKRVLDLLALQKINRFHWGLSNDQGWRIQIQQYPRLTEVGAARKQTQVGGWAWGKPRFDEQPYGGFYTQDEIREIVAYARENFIEVIPEINAPGHAAAAIAAYPQLACSGQPAEVQASFARSTPVCVGQEFTFEFLENVYAEIAALFPYGVIHIGGDEVKQTAWMKCPHCRARMAQAGLKTGSDLQAYFENRLARALQAKGLKVIAWSDTLCGGLDPAVINQHWFFPHRKQSLAELRKGRQTIVSDASFLYLDYSYKVIELMRTYTYEPRFPGLSDEQAANILGVEAPLWTEYVYSRERMDWQMFPRLLVVSETAWTPRGERNYPDFLARLEAFEQRLDALDVHHATRACYLKYAKPSLLPPMLKLLTREHPAMTEYLQFHAEESRR